MGQYHIPVNLDKREYINPHKLGAGLKLWEQLASGGIGGTSGALIVLLACSNGRGGGDFDTDTNWHGPERKFPEHNGCGGPMPEEYPAIAERTIGRWAGDRIAIIGDYAEDTDLQPEDHASLLYVLCHEADDFAEMLTYYHKRAYGKEGTAKDFDDYRWLTDQKPFTDISDDVFAVMQHELNLVVDDSKGWRDIRRAGEEPPSASAPDGVFTISG